MTIPMTIFQFFNELQLPFWVWCIMLAAVVLR